MSLEIQLARSYHYNMLYRKLGKTQLNASIVGFGGIVAARMPQEEANRAVADAIDRGVNYFDFAPSYMDCEERLGPALRGRRDKVILACKTAQRSKEGAKEEFYRSLKRLETDHFDIYQLHGVPNLDELHQALGPSGAMEMILEAREKGLIRFIGVTTHTPEVALEAFRLFDFDTVLFPINFIYWHNSNAGPQVLAEAAKKEMGRVAMKSMALTKWPDGCEKKWGKCWYQPNDDPQMAELAVRFTLSRDTNVMIPPGHLELFKMALKTAENYRPLEPDEEEYLREKAASFTPIFY